MLESKWATDKVLCWWLLVEAEVSADLTRLGKSPHPVITLSLSAGLRELQGLVISVLDRNASGISTAQPCAKQTLLQPLEKVCLQLSLTGFGSELTPAELNFTLLSLRASAEGLVWSYYSTPKHNSDYSLLLASSPHEGAISKSTTQTPLSWTWKNIGFRNTIILSIPTTPLLCLKVFTSNWTKLGLILILHAFLSPFAQELLH